MVQVSVKTEEVGHHWPMEENVGLLFVVFCAGFVSLFCVDCSFCCLPDETCSNGSPVFAGYFLPPIWKKMGSEDR